MASWSPRLTSSFLTAMHRTAECAAILLDRLCTYMDVDRNRLDLQLYTSPSADELPQLSIPSCNMDLRWRVPGGARADHDLARANEA